MKRVLGPDRPVGIRFRDIPHIAARLDLAPVALSVTDQLRQVENYIRAQAAAFDPAIVGYVQYVFDARGKGIRAALTLLGGGAVGQTTQDHVRVAAIVEMIHLASLVHDDILDNAGLRRGVPTAFAKWGPEIAVLLGDSLFAHALKLCTEFASNDVAAAMSDAAHAVCQGEILQTQRQFDLGMGMEDYRKIIGMKTASLFSVACKLGATCSGAPEPVIENLRLYGQKLGLAYQMYDDLLDLLGTEGSTGKTLGTDISKGKYTLPVLIQLGRIHGPALDAARATLLHGDAEARMDFIAELHSGGAFADAVDAVQRELADASKLLADLPDNASRSALAKMAELLSAHLDTFGLDPEAIKD